MVILPTEISVINLTYIWKKSVGNRAFSCSV